MSWIRYKDRLRITGPETNSQVLWLIVVRKIMKNITKQETHNLFIQATLNAHECIIWDKQFISSSSSLTRHEVLCLCIWLAQFKQFCLFFHYKNALSTITESYNIQYLFLDFYWHKHSSRVLICSPNGTVFVTLLVFVCTFSLCISGGSFLWP